MLLTNLYVEKPCKMLNIMFVILIAINGLSFSLDYLELAP